MLLVVLPVVVAGWLEDVVVVAVLVVLVEDVVVVAGCVEDVAAVAVLVVLVENVLVVALVLAVGPGSTVWKRTHLDCAWEFLVVAGPWMDRLVCPACKSCCLWHGPSFQLPCAS